MRLLAIAAGLAIIILTGVVHGDLSGRWGASKELQNAVARLDNIPTTIGDWDSVDFELDPQQVEIGEIAGYVARRYVGPDGDAYTVMLVCGRPGPISAHTPEWCYGGAGYDPEEEAVTEELEIDSDRRPAFWVNTFLKKRAPVPETLEICWSWNAGDAWKAPENARVAFAPNRFLYKLYVVRDASAADDTETGEAVRREFTRQLIPAVDAALFGGAGS